MLKKTIKYENYLGEEKEVVAYFGFTNSELLERSKDVNTDVKEIVNNLTKADANTIASIVEDFVLDAYGVQANNGDEFVKSEEVKQDFKRTAAFETLKWDLLSDPDAALNFMIGCFPSRLQKEINLDEIKAKTKEAIEQSKENK